MMIRVESWTEAVDGGAPRSWRRDFAGEEEDIVKNGNRVVDRKYWLTSNASLVKSRISCLMCETERGGM